MATLTEEQKKKVINLEGLSEFKNKILAKITSLTSFIAVKKADLETGGTYGNPEDRADNLFVVVDDDPVINGITDVLDGTNNLITSKAVTDAFAKVRQPNTAELDVLDDLSSTGTVCGALKEIKNKYDVIKYNITVTKADLEDGGLYGDPDKRADTCFAITDDGPLYNGLTDVLDGTDRAITSKAVTNAFAKVSTPGTSELEVLDGLSETGTICGALQNITVYLDEILSQL